MLRSTALRTLVLACLSGLIFMPSPTRAQAGGVEVLDAIRARTTLSDSDRDQIKRWIDAEVDKLKGAQTPLDAKWLTATRSIFVSQFDNSANSEPFRDQFVDRFAAVSAERFATPDIKPGLAFALALVLVEFDRVQSVPGLIAGLKSKDAGARLQCVKGLAALRGAIAQDDDLFRAVVAALKDAGLAEEHPVILKRIYLALAYTGRVGDVADVYFELFDRRLQYRGGPAVIADGAELEAYEFFRTPGVADALNADQKIKLVGFLAVFFRMDAERLNDSDFAPAPNQGGGAVRFRELDTLQRMLSAVDAILRTLVTPATPAIPTVDSKLMAGDSSLSILQLVQQWVGEGEAGKAGQLNADPWKVPAGAP